MPGIVSLTTFLATFYQQFDLNITADILQRRTSFTEKKYIFFTDRNFDSYQGECFVVYKISKKKKKLKRVALL